MAKLALFVVCFTAVYAVAQSKITCQTCPKVTEECEIKDAIPIDCGGNGVCFTKIRKNSPDKKLAIRKCAVPDFKTKKVDCPADSDCTECDTNLCNSTPNLKFSNFGVGLVGVAVTVLVPTFFL